MDERTINYLDFIPKEWNLKSEEDKILTKCFIVINLKKEDIVNEFQKINILNDVIALFIYGKIKYLYSGKCEIDKLFDCDRQIRSEVKNKTTNQGLYCLLLTPFEVAGEKLNEDEINKKINQSLGILNIFAGKAISYAEIFTNILYYDRKRIETFSEIIENPNYFKKPNIEEKNLNYIQNICNNINKLSNTEMKNKVLLSLDWFFQAIKSKNIDSFLKLWIAIEALTTGNKTASYVSRKLAEIYNMNLKDSNNYFMFGKISGYRDKVVHHGESKPIKSELLDYLEGIYIDLLFNYLKLDSPSKSKKNREKENFNLDNLLYY